MSIPAWLYLKLIHLSIGILRSLVWFISVIYLITGQVLHCEIRASCLHHILLISLAFYNETFVAFFILPSMMINVLKEFLLLIPKVAVQSFFTNFSMNDFSLRQLRLSPLMMLSMTVFIRYISCNHISIFIVSLLLLPLAIVILCWIRRQMLLLLFLNILSAWQVFIRLLAKSV